MTQGKATANSMTMQSSASHASHAHAAETEGTRSIRLQDAPAQLCLAGIGWDISREQITRDLGVGQFEKVREGSTFIACRLFVALAQIAHEQEIELLHPAPALPVKSAVIHGRRISAVFRASSS